MRVLIKNRPRGFLFTLAGLFILSVFFYPLVSGRLLYAGNSEIIGIDLSNARKYTRLMLELSAEPVNIDIKKSTNKLEIILSKCISRTGLSIPNRSMGVIDSFNINSRRSDTVVSINLKADTDYNIYQLPRYLNRPERLIVNFENPHTAIDKIFSQIAGKKHVVVIDPGHGGKDPGALGLGRYHEKDIVLDVAALIVKALSDDNSIKCVLTRDRDEFISLSDRVAISRNSGASLFMSIHCNSSTVSSARGAEVFYLSDKKASDAAADMLAQKENASFEIGLDNFNKDLDMNVLKILIDMKKNFVMTQSRDLASVIAFHLKQNKNVNIDRGVRRAGFMVLKAVSVPSVLVELGFISNSRESKLLGSSWYRVSIAESLAESIKSYLKKRDAGTGMPSLSGGGKKNSTKG